MFKLQFLGNDPNFLQHFLSLQTVPAIWQSLIDLRLMITVSRMLHLWTVSKYGPQIVKLEKQSTVSSFQHRCPIVGIPLHYEDIRY